LQCELNSEKRKSDGLSAEVKRLREKVVQVIRATILLDLRERSINHSVLPLEPTSKWGEVTVILWIPVLAP